MGKRDDFKARTKRAIATRVNYCCSNPGCKMPTVGPKDDDEGVNNIGVLAHITAAASGGPRFDNSLTSEERRSANNGMLLCQNCAKLIDTDEEKYTVVVLRRWKQQAENSALNAIAKTPSLLSEEAFSCYEIEADDTFVQALGLPENENVESLIPNIATSAEIDLESFKDTQYWPLHAVQLGFTTGDSTTKFTSIEGLAAAFRLSTEATLVSPPGTGKTTTNIQVAEAINASGTTIAAVVPLSEWANGNVSIFEALTRRKAFHQYKPQHFMLLAYCGRLVLMLDGWNELDFESRKRAISEIKALRRDYSLLTIVISTRRQALDTPLSGPIVNVEALSEEQQIEIAKSMRGDEGEALLDEAWRTPGVRELIRIPLYLTAILSSVNKGSMPDTREEVLRIFVEKHESDAERIEILSHALSGFHAEYLIALAADATNVSSTTLEDSHARAVVSDTEDRLELERQIKNPPNPGDVLDVLVSQHILVRHGVESGVSFQHQQFQEWYASFEVEVLMLAAQKGNAEAEKKLIENILNVPGWEEAILFASERMSHDEQDKIDAVAFAITRTLSIDPILGAQIIYRSSPAVWEVVETEVVDFISSWHNPGEVDRAVNFMITSGRPEFQYDMWPYMQSENNQVYYRALRAASTFRPSVLGEDIQSNLGKLSVEHRSDILADIAHNSGIDGMELATELAVIDPEPQVKQEVIEALLFRHADRHAVQVLKTASGEVWSYIAKKSYTDVIRDEQVKTKLNEIFQVDFKKNIPIETKLFMLTRYKEIDNDIAKQFAEYIITNEYPAGNNDLRWELERVFESAPQIISEALLKRFKDGLEMPYGCGKLLKPCPVENSGFVVDIVTDPTKEPGSAIMAASLVGKNTIDQLITRYCELKEILHSEEHIDNEAREEFFNTKDRISATRAEEFLKSILSFASTNDPVQISGLTELIASHGDRNEQATIQADTSLLESISDVIQRWISVMLAAEDATRHQLYKIADAIVRISRLELTQGLNDLLIQELTRREKAIREFEKQGASGHRPADITHVYTNRYQRAFSAIGGDEVIQIMKDYLLNPAFGVDAAFVLKSIYDKEHESETFDIFRTNPDFENVASKRLHRDSGETQKTTEHSEAIFAAIEQLIANGGNEEQHKLALKLARPAVRLPHGDKTHIIEALKQLPVSMDCKQAFIEALILEGYCIGADLLIAGVNTVLEIGKEQPWRVDSQRNDLINWIQLIPFSDDPEAVLNTLALVPPRYMNHSNKRKLLSALSMAPDNKAETVLLALAENDASLYRDYDWQSAMFKKRTTSSVESIIDLIIDGKITDSGESHYVLARDLSGFIKNNQETGATLIQKYKSMEPGSGKQLVEQTLCSLTTSDALLSLIQGYAKDSRPYDSLINESLRNIAIGQESIEGMGDNVYEEFSADVGDLRQKLFAMADKDQAEADIAIKCLVQLDCIYDEHGYPAGDTRHPDITLGRAWPIVKHDNGE